VSLIGGDGLGEVLRLQLPHLVRPVRMLAPLLVAAVVVVGDGHALILGQQHLALQCLHRLLALLLRALQL
jgi:hypothetical protein